MVDWFIATGQMQRQGDGLVGAGVYVTEVPDHGIPYWCATLGITRIFGAGGQRAGQDHASSRLPADVGVADGIVQRLIGLGKLSQVCLQPQIGRAATGCILQRSVGAQGVAFLAGDAKPVGMLGAGIVAGKVQVPRRHRPHPWPFTLRLVIGTAQVVRLVDSGDL